MHDFCFFLKTYRNDYKSVVRLIDSFQQYNEENIILYLVCPKQDVYIFQSLIRNNMVLLEEEEIGVEVFENDTRWSAGYLNQAIYKLAFGELALCKNYMPIDSDAIFIRPFYKKDFLYDKETPYTILIEDNDLHADRYYYAEYWEGRRKLIEKIEDVYDFHPYRLLTCHGFQIFSLRVLKDLKDSFMVPNGYTYKDLIAISPYEFSWYNLWLQKSQCMPIYMCEPLFKTFHLKQHQIFSVLQGMRIEDWAKAYIGIVVNSNYGVGDGTYQDISCFTNKNAGIPMEIIHNNYTFYNKMKKRTFLELLRKVISYVRKKRFN